MCSHLQSSEVNCMPLQKRTLLKKLPSLLKLLEEVKEELRTLKSNSTSRNFQRVSDGILPQRPYAETLKLNKSKPILVVKPRKDQASVDTKKLIRTKIDHLNISTFREAKNRAVIIGCESKQSITELKLQLSDNLDKEEYT